MKIRTGVVALALLLVAGVAQAQTVQFGAHGGLNIPVGDLGNAVDNRLGITLGGHVGLYYGGGHELRPRVDITYYDGGWHPEGNNTFSKNTIKAWGIGADYLYYTENRPTGLFLTMGLGLQSWNVAPQGRGSETNTALGLSAGAGFRVNRSFALEGRFTTGQFRNNSGQANALQILASVRF